MVTIFVFYTLHAHFWQNWGAKQGSNPPEADIEQIGFEPFCISIFASPTQKQLKLLAGKPCHFEALLLP